MASAPAHSGRAPERRGLWLRRHAAARRRDYLDHSKGAGGGIVQVCVQK